MKIGVMQPYFFPYIGYFQLIRAVDEFVFLNDVNFIKRGWVNRNQLPSGLFTLPVKDASQNRLITDTKISETYTKWREKFIKTLQHNYKDAMKSEAFEYITSALPTNLESPELNELLIRSIVIVCNYLKIRTPFSSSIGLHVLEKGQGRIIKICEEKRASTYINPIGGLELYEKVQFANFNIELKFLRTKSENKMSIIDLMLTKPKEEIIEMLKEYELLEGE